MAMRSLFLKIFLWFWMAFVIIAVTLASVVAITRSNEAMLGKVSLYMPLEARHAADIYEREGKTGLQHHFDHMISMQNQDDRVINSGFVEPYLLDENGKDVLGRNLPAGAAEFAKAAKGDVTLFSKFTGWNGFAAQQVIGMSGQRYTMLAVCSRRFIAGLIKGLSFKTLFSVLAILMVGGPFCYWLTCHIANPIVQLSEA